VVLVGEATELRLERIPQESAYMKSLGIGDRGVKTTLSGNLDGQKARQFPQDNQPTA